MCSSHGCTAAAAKTPAITALALVEGVRTHRFAHQLDRLIDQRLAGRDERGPMRGKIVQRLNPLVAPAEDQSRKRAIEQPVHGAER